MSQDKKLLLQWIDMKTVQIHLKIDKFVQTRYILPWRIDRLGTMTDLCRMGSEADTLRETPHGTAAAPPFLTADPAAPPLRTGSPARVTGENLAPIRLVSTTMVVLTNVQAKKCVVKIHKINSDSTTF